MRRRSATSTLTGTIDMVMGVIGGAYGPARTSIDNLYLKCCKRPRETSERAKRSGSISQIDVGSDAMPVLADLHGNGKLDLLIGSKISPTDPGTGTIQLVRECRHGRRRQHFAIAACCRSVPASSVMRRRWC